MTPKEVPEPRPYRLVNQIQHYAWGTRGEDAFIPRLLGIEAEEGEPYAELWMGAHPKAPSDVVLPEGRVSLRDLISQYPELLLGEDVCQAFSGQLPFLFKVLSTAEALSIQVHPTKEQARELHARDPEHYPDDNHKPELAVALDSLRALVGFRRLPQLREVLERYPELADFVGEKVVREVRAAGQPATGKEERLLRRLCTTLVNRSRTREDALDESLDRLAARLSAASAPLREREEVFLELREKYPGPDVGLFAIFYLNLVHLNRGEAIFLDAGTPHAYLRGNIVECMANSDNVVRAGLTPKFKDTETLMEIVDYVARAVPELDRDADARRTVYRTSNPEFEVTWWELEDGQPMTDGEQGKPEILLVTHGEAVIAWSGRSETHQEILRRGESVFIPAHMEEYTVHPQRLVEFFQVRVPWDNVPGKSYNAPSKNSLEGHRSGCCYGDKE